MDPTQKKVIYTSDGWAPYRGYLTPLEGRKQTDWLSLTKDEAYYIEVRHMQWSGGDHISVAVEIEDPTITPGHHHTMKEIQRLFVDQVLTREMTNITIDNPDGGEFALGFVDPVSLTQHVNRLNTNFTAWQFNLAVRDFYWRYYGAGIDVQKVMYEADGSVTTNSHRSVKSVYTIYVLRSLNSASCRQITIQKISTTSAITV